ncbi:MAG: IS30 family transposase [Candidatus Margulisbacteria bacterium]|nr:IS30 family transposase [Candidatus Margulisiibacteriota bacterium]
MIFSLSQEKYKLRAKILLNKKNQKKPIPWHFLSLITLEAVNYALNTLSFFCQPYHIWEKGSVEQIIGLIRRTYPKKTDLALLSQSHLDIIQDKLNHRPRKCLNFLSPHEAYVALAA